MKKIKEQMRLTKFGQNLESSFSYLRDKNSMLQNLELQAKSIYT